MSDQDHRQESGGFAAQAAVELLEAALCYRFASRELLLRALTHRSYSNERGLDGNYERLEFLGDAVFGLITSRWLYDRLPELPEGELAKLKSHLVSATVLGARAQAIGLGQVLRLGIGEDRSGGRRKVSILADAMEAIFGAAYLDGGIPAARQVIEPIVLAAYETFESSHSDAKTRLQELAQGARLGLPDYVLIEASGPDHDKLFTVECRIGGELFGRGEGKSKKTAEQVAARAALARLQAEA
jgi:ribonuclease III